MKNLGEDDLCFYPQQKALTLPVSYFYIKGKLTAYLFTFFCR